MKTIKLTFSALLLSLFIFACVKHEVIPAPIDTVILKPYFTGKINQSNVEYTDDVDGFNGVTSQSEHIVTSPLKSKVIYYCDMTSNLINTSIKVGYGSLEWDAGALEKPSLIEFNNFFTSILDPAPIFYGSYPDSGFEVEYKDAFGNTWNSDKASVNVQTVKFTKIENESDATGDYCKFTADFSCYVYRPTIVLGFPSRDSITIEDGHFEGWFLR